MMDGGPEKERRGQSAVEFALVLPLFLTMVFGIVEFGMMMYHRSLVAPIAREVVRMASVGISATTIANRAQSMLRPLVGSTNLTTAVGVDSEGSACTQLIFTSVSTPPVVITVTPVYNSTLPAGSTLRVATGVQYEFITPLSSLFGNTLTLSAVSYALVEKPPT